MWRKKITLIIVEFGAINQTAENGRTIIEWNGITWTIKGLWTWTIIGYTKF
jgi:hypothetical protein